jgi:thioesterase domain-containing protein
MTTDHPHHENPQRDCITLDRTPSGEQRRTSAGMGWASKEAKDQVASLLQLDPDALRMWGGATTGPHGGDSKSEDAQIKTDNVSLDPKHGNSLAYTLSRLARERPDLYAKVVAEEMSANSNRRRLPQENGVSTRAVITAYTLSSAQPKPSAWASSWHTTIRRRRSARR